MSRTPSGNRTSGALARALLALASIAAAGCSGGAPAPPEADERRPQRLPKVEIRVGEIPLVVEVADEAAERQKGMMFRKSPAPDEAMLFVFQSERNWGFWMQNCYADLDLAFIRADGTIAQIERLKAHDIEHVYSREPVRLALEVPAGWFEAHGIGPGTKVAIPQKIAPAASR